MPLPADTSSVTIDISQAYLDTHMRLAIFLMDRCFGSGIHSIIDALITSNYALHKSGLKPLFEWHTVALDEQPVTPTNGLQIKPDYGLVDYLKLKPRADIWILPAVFHSFSDLGKAQQALDNLSPIIPVIQDHHRANGLLVSICSGSFLLAEAGLLDHNPALMHWKSEQLFTRMFPKLRIDTHKTVADYGNIICTIGGGMAYEYLVLHLVARFAGHQSAVKTAKLMMINLNPPSPGPFRGGSETPAHSDKLVMRAQRFIENNSAEEFVFSDLAARLNISERQMTRRFHRALNCSPLQYLQRLRLQHACHLLEATHLPSNKIVYETGYQDESSFRRLFKKQLGSTMEEYRKQFGSEKALLTASASS
jgi:transcriptional regulator GlxA family with amidase domain